MSGTGEDSRRRQPSERRTVPVPPTMQQLLRRRQQRSLFGRGSSGVFVVVVAARTGSLAAQERGETQHTCSRSVCQARLQQQQAGGEATTAPLHGRISPSQWDQLSCVCAASPPCCRGNGLCLAAWLRGCARRTRSAARVNLSTNDAASLINSFCSERMQSAGFCHRAELPSHPRSFSSLHPYSKPRAARWLHHTYTLNTIRKQLHKYAVTLLLVLFSTLTSRPLSAHPCSNTSPSLAVRSTRP